MCARNASVVPAVTGGIASKPSVVTESSATSPASRLTTARLSRSAAAAPTATESRHSSAGADGRDGTEQPLPFLSMCEQQFPCARRSIINATHEGVRTMFAKNGNYNCLIENWAYLHCFRSFLLFDVTRKLSNVSTLNLEEEPKDNEIFSR